MDAHRPGSFSSAPKTKTNDAMKQRPWIKRAGYRVICVLSRVTGVLLFGLRVDGREHIPTDGGVLVCSNHQSYFDPVIVGLCSDRRLNYLARDTLFRSTLFRWLIEFLDAIPIDRDGMGIGGLKETLRRLKREEMVLIFPEGTRTKTGEVSPLKPGFCTLARRGKIRLLPVGIDGAFQAWPKGNLLPRLSRICVHISEPLTPEEMATMTDDELVASLEHRIRESHHNARLQRHA
jgi:1-acyl-sn-glycerol-3-phosphate acyltransferase